MNYFIVDTSFHMLAAIEARDVLARSQVNRLVVEARGATQGRALNLQQILALDDGKWDSIDVCRFPRHAGIRRSTVRLWRMLRIRLRHGSAETCYIATLSESWARRFARVLGSTRTIRLDDGTASIRPIQLLRDLGLDQTPQPRAFSMFHRPGDGPGIVANRFARLKSRASEGSVDPTLVWMIGGAYTEALVLSRERELSIFSRLHSLSDGANCIYLPHRADSSQKLDQIGALGITVAPPGPTFETRLLEAAKRPGWICGIGSTALLTSKLLFPDIRVSAVRLLPSPNRDYDAIYDQAGVMGIELIQEG